MRLLAASSITFTDLSDASGAMLTSDVLLVPCDFMGVPKLALASSPLTSRMIILQGGVEQTGWSFSRIQQGVTSSVDSSGVVSVTAISADNGYVEITASKSGHTPLVKKLTVSKVYQGETGSLASDFSIELSPAAFQISSRGMVTEAQVITATCRKTNIAGSPAITWTADAVQLSSTTGGTVAITIEASVMLASFTIGCSVAGYGTKTLEVQGIRSGSPRPLYLGLLASPPSDTPEGPLLYNPGLGGDYYLGTDMIPYWYDGTSFTSEGLSYVPNYADIMSHAAAEALKVPNTIPVTSALYAYFDHMSVTNAYIDGLRTRALKLARGGSIQSEQYIENQLGFLLKADGTFNAVNANLINAIISGSGTFKGIIDSLPLKTTTQSEAADPVLFDAKTHWYSDEMYAAVPLTESQNLQAVSGSYKGKAFTHATKLGSGVQAVLGSTSGSGTSYGAGQSEDGDRHDVTVPVAVMSLTVPAGASTIQYSVYCTFSGSSYPYPRCYVTRNGTQVANHAGLYKKQTVSGTISVSPGNTVVVYVRGSASHDSDFGWSYMNITGSGSMNALSALVGQGLFLKYTDNTFDLIGMGRYSNGLSMTGYAPVHPYAKAAAFVSGVSAYAVNELKTASGTLLYNGQSYQVIGVMKTSATTMTVFHENGSINFSLPDSDPGTSGYYNASGSFAVIASVAGADTMNINAREADTYSIGNILRFLNIIGKNLIGENLNLGGMAGYACRAWGTFFGTSLSFAQQKGMSSITDAGTGEAIVNFASPMPHAHYAAALLYGRDTGSGYSNFHAMEFSPTRSTTSMRVGYGYGDAQRELGGSLFSIIVFS